MALIQCYECEREISDKAAACPHCGAPKEEQPPKLEEVEILESVAVLEEPEPINQETVSVPFTEPEPGATKDAGFNLFVMTAVVALVWGIANGLGGFSNVSMAIYHAYGELAGLVASGLIGGSFVAGPGFLLMKYGKKQSPQAYAGIIIVLLVVYVMAVVAGPGAVFITALIGGLGFLLMKYGTKQSPPQKSDLGQLAQKGTYAAGELDGPYELYYGNGQLQLKSTYVAGKRHGPFEDYYENGQLYSKSHLVDGKRDGPYERYAENGQLESTGTYNMGRQCGEWIEDGETVTYDPC
jgi:hypothetical protein